MLVLLMMVLFFVGCGPQPEEVGPEEVEPEEVEPEEVEYPTKTVRVIVPWPAGGRTDTATRVWADALSRVLDENVIVENREGGGGQVGSTAVINSTPDGHTMGIISISLDLAQWTSDPAFSFEGLTPVCRVSTVPLVLSVRQDSPWETFEDLVEYAKENPGKLRIGASGTGTSDHVIFASLFDMVGIDIISIPYAGDAPAITATITGEVDISGAPMIAIKPQVDAGELRPLAMTGENRSVLYPDVPTVIELGYSFVGLGYDGIYVPKDTPLEIVKILAQAFENVLSDPVVVDTLEGFYLEPAYLPAEGFEVFLREQRAVLEQTVRDLGLYIAD